MTTWINRALLVANIVLFALVGWAAMVPGLPLQASQGWEYKDLIAALLTVVTIVVAFMGLAVALAAVWGWQTISQGASERSWRKTEEHLSSDAFKQTLRLLMAEQAENMQKSRVQDSVVAESAVGEAENRQPDEEWRDE